MSGAPDCRICLVTPPAFEPAAFALLLARVLDAGDVASLRLRMPGADDDDVARAAEALMRVTHRADIALLLDGDAALARRLGLAGAHVPADRVAAARAAFGDAGSVGAACGASYDDAMGAAEAGADYVCFGPVSGPRAVARETVADWASAMVVPGMVAGGIAQGTAGAWASTGAEFLEFGRAAWESPGGPEQALRALLAAIAAAPRPA
ncbi:MAG: thiamine phosphate synthase [Alphaproteobacteria bacterium]